MSKKLDTAQITNELSEGSAFFRPAAKPVAAPVSPPSPAPPEPTVKQPAANHQPSQTSPADKTRAFIKRTFDLYEDQLNYLNRESLQERLAGKESSMNAMLREALDQWIAKREATK